MRRNETMSIFVRSPKIRLATVKRGKLHNRPGSKESRGI
jgi:hypothetical protein